MLWPISIASLPFSMNTILAWLRLVAAAIMQKTEILEQFPELGRPDYMRPEYRQIVLRVLNASYVLQYRYDGERLVILRVFHAEGGSIRWRAWARIRSTRRKEPRRSVDACTRPRAPARAFAPRLRPAAGRRPGRREGEDRTRSASAAATCTIIRTAGSGRSSCASRWCSAMRRPGTVVEVGANVTGLKLGDRVCMEPGIPDPSLPRLEARPLQCRSERALLGDAADPWLPDALCRPSGRLHLQAARQRVLRRSGDGRAVRGRPAGRLQGEDRAGRPRRRHRRRADRHHGGARRACRRLQPRRSSPTCSREARDRRPLSGRHPGQHQASRSSPTWWRGERRLGRRRGVRGERQPEGL